MKFDPYVFLTDLQAKRAPSAIRAIRANLGEENSTISTISTSQPTAAAIPDQTVPPLEGPTINAPAPQLIGAFTYGYAINGNVRTWTGRIVELDEWRHLSEWDKHGSVGKRWNGLTKQWEPD